MIRALDARYARFIESPLIELFLTASLNAGTLGPNALEGRFGPQVVFSKTPPIGQANLSPFSGLQFFGEVNIQSYGELTVDLRDINGVSVFSKTLQPQLT